MRGLIFTELFELIEEKFGYEFLDELIVDSKLPNDGAYSTTGNYPFDELLTIVVGLSEKTGVPIPDLLELYGTHLFPTLVGMFPEYSPSSVKLLDFITQVETFIHVEVKKLYPDVELPKFEILEQNAKSLTFHYVSSKKLHHLAKGLLIGASAYFNEPAAIDLKEEGDKVLVTVTKDT